MSIFLTHKRKILASVLFAISVYAVILVSSDAQKLAAVLRGFRWDLLPLVLILTLLNYGLRFIKWHYYLHLVGVANLSLIDSLLIFLAGFSMTLTPAKSGEWLKSFLVRERAGTPIATTAPIVLAERMTDGLAMLLLASIGLFLFDDPLVRGFVLVIFTGAVLLIILVQNKYLLRPFGNAAKRISVLANQLDHLRAFYSSAYQLLRFKSLAVAVGLGFVSWSGECLALAIVLYGLGVPFSAPLVVLSAFAMGFATLAGSILLTPGGLGVAEGSIDGLLLTFGHQPWLLSGQISQAIAGAATLMIRFATLWFGVTLGFVALLLATRRFRQNREGFGVGPTADTSRTPDLIG